MPDCPFNPAAENIADLIYRFGSLQSERWNNTSSLCADYVSSDYIILHMPLTPDAVSMRVHPYYMIPSLFSPLDYNAMEHQESSQPLTPLHLTTRERAFSLAW